MRLCFFLYCILTSYTVLAQKSAPFFLLESKEVQTFQSTTQQQLVNFGNQNKTSAYVAFDAAKQTFSILEKGYYEIQMGMVLHFNLIQPLPKQTKLWAHVMILDSNDTVLETTPYFMARDAVKEPTYVETPHVVVYVKETTEIRVIFEFQSGQKFIEEGVHSTATPYFPFAKSINIRKL